MGSSNIFEVLSTAKLTVVPASASFLEWLAEHQIPAQIIAELIPVLVAERDALLGNHGLYTQQLIIREDQNFPECLQAGFLTFGSCSNGDPIMIDTTHEIGTIGYLSHDEAWEDEGIDLRAHYVKVADTLFEFLIRAANEDVPYDYYEAVEKLQ